MRKQKKQFSHSGAIWKLFSYHNVSHDSSFVVIQSLFCPEMYSAPWRQKRAVKDAGAFTTVRASYAHVPVSSCSVGERGVWGLEVGGWQLAGCPLPLWNLHKLQKATKCLNVHFIAPYVCVHLSPGFWGSQNRNVLFSRDLFHPKDSAPLGVVLICCTTLCTSCPLLSQVTIIHKDSC